MKKKLLSCLMLASIGMTAQVKIGLKGGLNYNKFGDLKTATEKISADGKTGFHVGGYARVSLLGFFIQPELLYNNISSKYKGDSFTQHKIDVPVLTGVKIVKVGRVYAGPSFQYAINNDYVSSLSEVKTDDFTVGALVGAGVDVGKIGIDLRYDIGLNKNTAHFINQSEASNIEVDTRPSQFLLSLSYQIN